MRVFRVLPYLAGAKVGEPGHPLTVPTPQTAGRISNPDAYRVLYVSDAAAGAVAERFGDLNEWSDEMFKSPGLATRLHLAAYELGSGRVLDLDDARVLLDRGLRPSQIVTRDREITRAWALAMYDERAWAGVRWWSYYEPSWGSFGLWDVGDVEIVGVSPLDGQSPWVLEAASTIKRVWAR